MARKQVSAARQVFMNGLLADERARMERKRREAGELFSAVWDFRDAALRLREAASVYREHQGARKKDLEDMLDLTDVESGIASGTVRLRENPVTDDDGGVAGDDGDGVGESDGVSDAPVPPAAGPDDVDDSDGVGDVGDDGFPWSDGERYS
ncbi:hypothetical protein BTIS_0070 [Bifidobacterium tissieri]|uniref:Uncharacterized protein n=1 Tax=Bifidobacterium tissieri TaxID=1630162 RepID=A0A261FJL2_9BIFI|nr:hypothetical protein [Bifidobacterium tissieri]OZG59339.1 hypothetical protein BTIS_0070 [Bifidobacterium tissieri]